MFFITSIYEPLFFLIICCRIAESDNRLTNYFSTFELFLSNSKIWVSKTYSKVETSMPTFEAFSSMYHKKLNSFTSVADKIVTRVYNKLKNFVNNFDFPTHLTMNASLWNCWPLKEFSNPCSLFNATAPDYLIKQELYGQHLVHYSINKFLKTHLSSNHPSKPLVMSFHGSTGSGKSFVSKMIADTLYQNGYNSKYVHVYHGSIDFPHKKKKTLYQKRLRNEIFLFTKICERSLFIFDEIDKMIPGVIDVLIPFLMFNEKDSKIDFRKHIFIFISNIGCCTIEQITYDAWMNGVSREDLTVEAFSSKLKDAAYDSPNGLQHSEFVNENLIDVFVPFLPLEKKHVKECIVREFKLRKLPYEKEVVERVANQFVYNPPEFQIFSASGCKKVSHKVDLYGENDV